MSATPKITTSCFPLRTAVLSLGGFAVTCLMLCVSLAHASAVSPLPAANYTTQSVCAAPAPGHAGCLAQLLVGETAAARAHTHPLGITSSHPIAAAKASEGAYGLRPQDLNSAYFPGEPPYAPVAEPQTIALVDAYDDLDAEADLKVYDEEFALPECTEGNGCFEQVNQNGATGDPPFPGGLSEREQEEAVCESATAEPSVKEAACIEVEEADGWALETSLDIEVAHAVCQNCRILLVESDSSQDASLEAAEDAAVKDGAGEVSDSWGGEEPLTDSEAFNHPGTVITVAAGDTGYLNWDTSAEEEEEPEGPKAGEVNYPASSPHVIAVGGTRLTLSGPGEAWSGESVWRRGGGGCSLHFTAQEWQRDVPDWSSVGCEGRRAVADISADAAPGTGVAVYDSVPYVRRGRGLKNASVPGWTTVGGTSLSSPIIASMFALAGGAHGVAYPARTLYSHLGSSSLHDITEGANGKCEGDYSSGCTGSMDPLSLTDCGEGVLICNAAVGYDGPSGVGTPNGIAAFEPSVDGGPPETPITEACAGPIVAGTGQPVCGTLNPHARAKAGYYFAYHKGASCAGGERTPLAAEVEGEAIAVSGELTGLEPGTEYAYCLIATNASGETSGQALTFTTEPAPPVETPPPEPPPVETTPVVLGESASSVTSTTVALAGTIEREPTVTEHYYFEYGEAEGYGHSTVGGEVAPGAGEAAVGPEVITGLNPGTTYHYRLVAVSASGEGDGEEKTFRTLTSSPIVATVTPIVFPTMPMPSATSTTSSAGVATDTLAFSGLSLAAVQHGNSLGVSLTVELAGSRVEVEVAAPAAQVSSAAKKGKRRPVVLARLVRKNVASGRVKLTVRLDAKGRRGAQAPQAPDVEGTDHRHASHGPATDSHPHSHARGPLSLPESSCP